MKKEYTIVNLVEIDGKVLNLETGNPLNPSRTSSNINHYDKEEKITISISRKRLIWLSFHGLIPSGKYVCCKHQNLDYGLNDLYLSESKHDLSGDRETLAYPYKMSPRIRSLANTLYEERQQTKLSYRKLAKKYNVSYTTVFNLVQTIKSEREDSKNL